MKHKLLPFNDYFPVSAPGHYAPEKSVKALDFTPQYTFGMSTQVDKPADTPGRL